MKRVLWLKRFFCVLLSSSLLFSNSNAWAADRKETVKESGSKQSFEEFAQDLSELCAQDSPYIGKIVFDVQRQSCEKDGVPVQSKHKKVKMEKINNRCMVPAELLVEAIGGELSYNNNLQIATFHREGEKLSVSSGDAVLVTQNEIRKLDEHPYIKDECMMVPLEDIVQALGMSVETVEGNTVITDDFQTKRLVIKSSGNIVDKTATQIIDGYDDLHILQYESREDAMDAYEAFRAMDSVEYVQPDGVYSLNDTVPPNTDTVTTTAGSTAYHSWGVEKMGIDDYQQYLTENYSTLPDLVVAVLDTGIDYSNSFFDNRIAGNGVNYVNSIPWRPGSTSGVPQDDNGHGTAVSGIIVESTLSNVSILPVKVMDKTGSGTDSTIYMGINYAIQKGVDVINMSLGGDGTSSLYQDGIQKAKASGIPVVVAAGNESKDVAKVTPANVEEAITVSSINSNNGFSSSFSNYGSYVDVTAPGEAIEVVALSGGFKTASGTSFSAPHITASIALLKSANYYMDVDGAISLLKASTVDLGSSGWDKYFGCGMVSLTMALSYCGIDEGVKGDVDGDGEVTPADALLILRYVAEIQSLDDQQIVAADVDVNGNITVSDAFMILKYVAQIT